MGFSLYENAARIIRADHLRKSQVQFAKWKKSYLSFQKTLRYHLEHYTSEQRTDLLSFKREIEKSRLVVRNWPRAEKYSPIPIPYELDPTQMVLFLTILMTDKFAFTQVHNSSSLKDVRHRKSVQVSVETARLEIIV